MTAHREPSPYFLEEVAAFVQNETYVVGVLAGIHLRVD